MSEAPTSRFVLRLAAAEDAPDAVEVIEAVALDLRTELADAGVLRLDQVTPGEAPAGTRALGEIVAVCSFIITAVQAGESMTRVVTAVRRVVDRYARSRQRMRVTIAGVEVDLATADDGATARIVQALLALPAQPSTGVRDALVIANAHYDDPGLAQLRSPSHDADALARVLGDPAIGGFNVDLVTDADERTIRRRIAGFFANRDRDDLLLLHFSCHGIKDTRGRLHLSARDTDLSVLGATSVPASFVHQVLDETQSRRVVLILDCCYSGAFTRGASVRSGNDVHIADEFGAGSGRVVLTASSATEYAFEGADLTQAQAQPSVFTAALVDGLQSGAADLDADGEISIDELYDYTYRMVRDRTPGQAPMKWSFGMEGSLVVARSIRPAALPTPIVDDLTSERVVLRLEGVRALAQLSTSDRPGLRNLAVTTLAGLADTDDSVQVRRAAVAAIAGNTATDAPVPEERRPTAKHQARTPEAVVAADGGTEPPPAVRPVPDPRTAAGAGGLLTAAGLLIPTSVLLYVVAVYGMAEVPLDEDWYHGLVMVAEAIGAGLLLATRHTRWVWFLLGVLAWAWVYLAATLHSSSQSYFQDAWGLMATAHLAAVAAQACLVVAITRDHATRSRPDPVRSATAVVLAALALTTTLLFLPLLYEATHLDTAEGDTLRVISGIACAATILAVMTARPGDRGGAFLPLGWLLGGAELTLAASVSLLRDGTSDSNYTKLILVWILLIVTAAAALTAPSVLGRGRRNG